jgi:hypothetical protein
MYSITQTAVFRRNGWRGQLETPNDVAAGTVSDPVMVRGGIQFVLYEAPAPGYGLPAVSTKVTVPNRAARRLLNDGCLELTWRGGWRWRVFTLRLKRGLPN